MRYITGGVPWTDERIQLFVNRQMELFLARGFCRWKLLVKPTEEMIGFCGVGFWGDELEAEIGWRLARPDWGRGLNTGVQPTSQSRSEEHTSELQSRGRL